MRLWQNTAKCTARLVENGRNPIPNNAIHRTAGETSVGAGMKGKRRTVISATYKVQYA